MACYRPKQWGSIGGRSVTWKKENFCLHYSWNWAILKNILFRLAYFVGPVIMETNKI